MQFAFSKEASKRDGKEVQFEEVKRSKQIKPSKSSASSPSSYGSVGSSSPYESRDENGRTKYIDYSKKPKDESFDEDDVDDSSEDDDATPLRASKSDETVDLENKSDGSAYKIRKMKAAPVKKSVTISKKL